MRPSYLEVNLNAIQKNLAIVKQLVGKKKIFAVVKADAYGLGIIPVTKTLKEAGADSFAVALIEEGEVLRKNNIDDPVLFLAPYYEENIPDLIHLNIIPTVEDKIRAKALNDYAYKMNIEVSVHVKIDTGMGRLGVPIEKADELFEYLESSSNIKIAGAYTHFPSADLPDVDFTKFQIQQFCEFILDFQRKTNRKILCHSANSGGIVVFPDSHFDAVRPGLMLYGAYPSPYVQTQVELNKVVKLKSKILSIKKLKKGESVSYGRQFIAKNDMTIAIVPLGYADGYSTHLSNNGDLIVNNCRTPILGRICMDYIMIDVTAIKGIAIGDDVTLIGDGITEEELAVKSGLIPYEILTSISKRIPRVYI